MKRKDQYNLFRAKISFPSQGELFLSQQETPQTLFKKCLHAQSQIKYRKRHLWKAGNIHMINSDGGYFAFGKVSVADLELFDNEQQEFERAKYTSGPHSIVVFSIKYELLAIQVNYKLGSTDKIAENIQSIFRKVDIISSNNITLLISKLRDPHDFIYKIRNAYAIKQLRATFTRPNPFDSDEKFQKPSEKALLAINGEEGLTIFKGSNLDPEVVESISRSTASTGNIAKAKVQQKPNSRAKTISIKGDAYSMVYEGETTYPEQIYNDMIDAYKKIRGNF